MKVFLTIIFSIGFACVAIAQANLNVPVETHKTVAFLRMAFVDTSLEGASYGVQEAEINRILLVEKTITDRMIAEGFDILDNAPIQKILDGMRNPAGCTGCVLDMAQRLEADYVLIGEIKKVSTLIQSMNLVLRDATDGTILRGASVDLRGNTDEAWLRAINYIFTNHFFPEPKNE